MDPTISQNIVIDYFGECEDEFYDRSIMLILGIFNIPLY